METSSKNRQSHGQSFVGNHFDICLKVISEDNLLILVITIQTYTHADIDIYVPRSLIFCLPLYLLPTETEIEEFVCFFRITFPDASFGSAA